MAAPKQTEKVPNAMQDKFDRIVAITDPFAQKHLNKEYAQMIRKAVAALCRKRPSPLKQGQDKSWACGITHAIGMVNFLYDPAQDPHISAQNLYKAFGVSASTGQAKSKQTRDSLDMVQLDPDWCLPSLMDDNPMAWLISVDGFIMDARSAPRVVQEAALAKGLIPYLPGEAKIADSSTPVSPRSQNHKKSASSHMLYRLEVFLMGGPITEDFIAQHPEVSRVIEIKGSHTLQQLHQILFKAFDREEEHLYEFQVGGTGSQDPKAMRYGLRTPFSDSEDLDGEVSTTRIMDVGLAAGDIFGYWFDFGDDWWHQINVLDIIDKTPKGKYPKIVSRIGDSPPQYADFD
ncbi:plasmid pRiA4b ORF-3 family protein [Acaryochloris sp. IP29b_bin.148]|uniref:plasmid pRiA4b ORF-3 family protein n=1 Tax=Acaryochloris sp. IP29b_bin.148 TaxID=2969218 RepID=UPI002625BF60|nr:plasmid pRiA4b ORF-3 family protein [Acaryochloris sp. IP29b_bin.148]